MEHITRTISVFILSTLALSACSADSKETQIVKDAYTDQIITILVESSIVAGSIAGSLIKK